MKKTYIKPEIKTLHIAPQSIIASSFISPELPPAPEEDDERVDATANQTIWEDFGGMSGFNSYEQHWNSRYDW